MIQLATKWRLPLNEAWYFPADDSPAASAPASSSSSSPPSVCEAVEDALHGARWTLKDSEVGALLEKAARRKNGSNNNDGGGGVRMVRQGFLTHLETQGEVLEGFVLMALEVASVAALTRLVQAYNAEMAPHHDRTLAALLTLGRRCHAATTDARLLAAIGDDGGAGGLCNGGISVGAIDLPALSLRAAAATLSSRERPPARQPSRPPPTSPTRP